MSKNLVSKRPVKSESLNTFQPQPQYLSTSQLAEILGVHRETVYRAIRRGEIPHIKILSKILIPKSFLEADKKGGA